MKSILVGLILFTSIHSLFAEEKLNIYDPEAMKRIDPNAEKAEFHIKDYFVNVLIIEYPVTAQSDIDFLNSLNLAKVTSNEITNEAEVPVLISNLFKSSEAKAPNVKLSWDKANFKSAKFEKMGSKVKKLSEKKAYDIFTEALVLERFSENGWVTLPKDSKNNPIRVKNLIESSKKISGLERILTFILPVSTKNFTAKNAPLLLVSSNDLVAEGTVQDVLPTLSEAIQSEPEDKSVAEVKGKSLFKNFASIEDKNRVGVAYFLGGRTAILYRPYLDKKFQSTGVKVELYSKSLYDRKGKGFLKHRDYYRIPEEHVFTDTQFKATGIELIELMMAGSNIGASIGETAFIQGVTRKVPMVAVAELGFDAKETPGHAMVLCQNHPYNKPEDLKGLKFGSRRSAGGDELFMREFFSSIGLDPSKDIQVFGNMADDKLGKKIQNGELDGMYAHLMSIPEMPKHCRVIRKLDWVNPEVSSSLLVFPKDWLAKNRENVKKMLRVVVEQIAFEHKMTKQERRKKEWKNQKGIEIEMDTEDMQLPKVRDLPTVRIEMLNAIRDLLKKHKVSEPPSDLSSYIDNSILEEIGKELNIQNP
jgi:ABC-type nitrate/sulfonate/bicarbonate transport system substrate-binding protein